tara:strand:+ start:4152 stop:5219 length:1068 start_codon:yes stop_codon:yes gene_type:complete
MKKNHNFFSKLALNLAENHLGKTKTNPSVGCIVVKDDAVISSGVTSLNGRPHAEFNALSKNLNFKNSIMYVTLEPCTHYGLTPPCTKIIKEKKIKDVYYCFDDPDIRTFKKAKKELKKNRISLNKVNIGNKDFYKSYFLNKKKSLPLVDAKLAVSKDYFSISKRSKWITNERSRKVGHLLRSRYDCIISTSTSINKDNSLLNCRINGLNNNKPDLIIIDRNLKLKKNLRFINIANTRKTYIFTTSNDNKKINYFEKKMIKVITINKLDNKKDFSLFLKKVFKLGNSRILIEAGMIFFKKLITLKLIDNLYIFRSNLKLGNYGRNNINSNFIKKFKLKKRIDVNLGGEDLFKVKIK